MELNEMSVKQLNEVAAKAHELALSKRGSALEDLYQNVLAQVQAEGFSLDEVVELHKTKQGKASKSPKSGAKIPAKYRDANGNTWTGRGKQPKWIVAALEEGISLDTFLIEAPVADEAPTEVEVPQSTETLAVHTSPAPVAPSFGQRQVLPGEDD